MTIDRFLQAYVIGANNDTKPGAEITLCIGGMLISGRIIGANLYGTLQRTVSGTEQKAEDIEGFDRMFAETQDAEEFIHLQNAKFFLPNGQKLPISRNMFWRGRLSAVDGFFFGQIGD